MKKTITIAFILTVVFISSCSNVQEPSIKLKDVNEIAKLSEEQYAKDVSTIYLNTYKEMVDLIYDSKKIDANFEKKIDKIFENGARQMLQYGKAMDLKDSETREIFILSAETKALGATQALDKKYTDQVEVEFLRLKKEFINYGSPTLESIMDAIFSLTSFLDDVRLKEEMPEMAKRFGVE